MDSRNLPQHISIVMDGNGRWAKKRLRPRFWGHRQGVETIRRVVKFCGDFKVPYLSLFAFSTENWSRPDEEVHQLMELFLSSLKNEVPKLHSNDIKLRFIGDIQSLSDDLRTLISEAESLTKNNLTLTLCICINYGGKWDIIQAANKALKKQKADQRETFLLNESDVAKELSTTGIPDPDLLIRTSGELRMSNFLLWQTAYTELHFTETLWPDFNLSDFEEALKAYEVRQRRFGKI